MENLSFLQLCQGPEIDSFAPLAESSVQYLSMSLSQGAQEAYKDMDYTPLTQMPQLIWLDLTNNITFDTETCKKLLANDKILVSSLLRLRNAPKCKNTHASAGMGVLPYRFKAAARLLRRCVPVRSCRYPAPWPGGCPAIHQCSCAA